MARLTEVQRFSDEQEWIAKNRHAFEGKWVALDGGKLLASGPNAMEVHENATAFSLSPFLAWIEPAEAAESAGAIAMILLRTILAEAERTGTWQVAADLQERIRAICKS